jgi:hypothetical protein
MIKYYTDGHTVDEDIVSVIIQGGSLRFGIAAGVTYRHMDVPPIHAWFDVASYV